MKIENIDKVEELIRLQRQYAKFYDFNAEAVDDLLVLDDINRLKPEEFISLCLQIEGPRKTSKALSIPFGSDLYSRIMECVEGEINRVEDELSEL